jgi:hypothetical protein
LHLFIIIIIASDLPYTVGVTLVAMVTRVTFLPLQLRQAVLTELQAEAGETVERRTCNIVWHNQIAALRRMKLKREFVYA